MKYFVVSDIHDHYTLMKAALDEQGFDPAREDHMLVLCGDAVYYGDEPGETFAYLRDLHERGKLIFVYGNHDYELLDCLKREDFGKGAGNRKCAQGVVAHLTGKTGLPDAELIRACRDVGFTDFLQNVPVPYFETGHYVFTHGFIPTAGNAYRPNWRAASPAEWRQAVRSDGMVLSMRHHVRVPDKTIVFGHYSAARCYLMEHATEADWENKIYTSTAGRLKHVPDAWFKPFFGECLGFIAMDQSLVQNKKKKWFVNCIILQDDPLPTATNNK